MSTGTNKERITENNGIISENNADLTALKTRIDNLPTSGDTTATANDIAVGKTAVSKGVKLTGTLQPGIDTSDATATASDMASGKTAYVNGEKVTGNLIVRSTIDLGSQGVTDNPKDAYATVYARLANKAILPDNAFLRIATFHSQIAEAVGLTSEILKKDETVLGVTGTYEGEGGGSSKEEKDVNFYDYDGTIVYSYTRSEFELLDTMPANPTHAGLISQGWNWSMSAAQDYILEPEFAKLNIGQMYATSDGKTRIYIKLEEGRLEPSLGFALNGTATIDWGDNTTSTVTGTSRETTLFTKHTYSTSGEYVIIIDSTNGIYLIGDTNHGSNLLVFEASSANSKVYQNAIQKVELGSNVRSVGVYTFANCFSLSSITIPSGITSIENYAFTNCFSLSSITIPSGVTSIGNYAFSNCSSLTSIIIPNNLTTIGSYAFHICNSLANITIPTSVTTIGSYAFHSCDSLTSILIPSGVTSIQDYVFYGCNSLTNITIPTSVTTIGNYAFHSCDSLTSILIPSGVTTIGLYAFTNCRSLTSIIISSDVTTIGTAAFSGCTSLSSITIPSGITSIGNNAFQTCYALANITILSGVISIGTSAFANCYGVAFYDFTSATNVPTLSSKNAFNGILSDCKIIVPDDLYEDWIGATNWSNYASYIIKASDWV